MRFHPESPRATLLLIVSCSALAGCEGGSPSVDGAGTVVVTPEAGGTIVIEEGPLAGLTLVVPAGAVAEPVEITVAPREDLDETERPIDVELDPAAIGDIFDALRETVEGFDEVDSYGVLFLLEAVRQRGHEQAGPVLALSPSGLTFDRPVSLTLPYDESALTDPALAVALTVAHWSDDGRVRMVRPLSVDEEARTVTVELDHFSDVSPTSGAANTLAEMGAARTGTVPPVAVPPTGFFQRLSRRVGGDCVPGDLTSAVARLTDAMSNGCNAGALDTTIPPHVGVNILLAHLTLMNVIFFPGTDPDLVNEMMHTGREQELLAYVIAQPGQVTFEQAMRQSLVLNRNNAFDALMTVHNLVRDINYTPAWLLDRWGMTAWNQLRNDLGPKLAPLTDLDPRITDTVGAWYHIAGLATLSLYSRTSLVSRFMGAVDEVVISGLSNNAFECGEYVANIIGSKAGSAIRDRVATPPACPMCVAELSYCVTDEECCSGLACIVDQCLDCTGRATTGEVCDPTNPTACCGTITCAPVAAADDFRCCLRDTMPCLSNTDCCGAMNCVDGTCRCQAAGEPCLTGRECCGGSICGSAGRCL